MGSSPTWDVNFLWFFCFYALALVDEVRRLQLERLSCLYVLGKKAKVIQALTHLDGFFQLLMLLYLLICFQFILNDFVFSSLLTWRFLEKLCFHFVDIDKAFKK